jgi:hypothetical protein
LFFLSVSAAAVHSGATAWSEMRFYLLVLGILAVWRLTHLLVAEDGPWDAVVRLRGRAGAGFWGRLLDCFYCLSLWIAAPFALLVGVGWRERLLLWPALSAGAILLERITSPARGAQHGGEERRQRPDPSKTRRSTMPCCGDKRRQFSDVTPSRRAPSVGVSSRGTGRTAADSAVVYFEYTGKTGIMVWGTATARRYVFTAGTKVGVDGRDAPSLNDVPELRRVEIA